jgi:glycosyltransferase involved in cell wall biosynthesis
MAAPARVALDLRMVGARPHGIARYARALWDGLPADSDLTFTALCGPETGDRVQKRRPGDELVVCRERFLSLREQMELPSLLRLQQIDLLHATSFSAPALWRGSLVMTLHDLNHLALPAWSGPGRRAYYRLFVRPAARRAARVLTVSQFAADEISRFFKLPASRIAIAPNGLDGSLVPPHARALLAARQRNRWPDRYFLYVGNGRPHKNLRLLDELSRLLPSPLILVAGLTAKEGRQFRPNPRLHLLPSVPDEELPALYGGATAFLFPSLYEGFGLPPLEAAACGTPVLVADTSALREIWTGAAVLLPPNDAEAWRAALTRLLDNPSQRATLATACQERAERFRSWVPAVSAALLAYRSALRLT